MYCNAAFNHLHITTNGLVTPCCINHETIYGDLKLTSLSSILSSDHYSSLNTKLQSQSLPGCELCDKFDRNNIPSQRLYYNNIQSKSINLRLSNLCNLQCVMCGHDSSNLWHQYWLDNNLIATDTPSILDVPSQPENLTEILNILPQYSIIYFTGGEPLINLNHYHILQFLIDNKLSPKLLYNSNLTKLSINQQNALTYWEHFDVTVSISFDGFNDLANFVRKGINFSVFEKNVDTLLTTNVNIRFTITVSIVNISHLSDIVIELLKRNWISDISQIDFNIVENPYFLKITSLPSHSKHYIMSHYIQDCVLFPEHIKFKYVYDYMMSEDTSYQLVEGINYLNSQSPNFKDLYPDNMFVSDYAIKSLD